MVNNHNRFINNYSAVERGCFLPAIRSKQEPNWKSVKNRSQRAYTWPHKQISTNWKRLNPWLHKWNSRSVCVRRRLAVSAFDAVLPFSRSTPSCRFCVRRRLAVSVLLRLHSTNVCLAFLLFCRVVVSLHLHSVLLRLHSVSFRSFPWCLRSKTAGISAILPQAPPFF